MALLDFGEHIFEKPQGWRRRRRVGPFGDPVQESPSPEGQGRQAQETPNYYSPGTHVGPFGGSGGGGDTGSSSDNQYRNLPMLWQPNRAYGSESEELADAFSAYQRGGGQWQQYGVRAFQGMDLGGNHGANPFTEDNVSDDGRAAKDHPVIAEMIRRGHIREQDADAALWELRNTGDVLYRPGQVRTFGAAPTGPTRSDGITGLDPRLRGQTAATWRAPGAPGSSGPFSGSGSSAPGWPGPSYSGGAFDDPASNFAEQTALARYGQRTGPQPGSGTALYEDFARQFANLLQAPPFTDQEEAAMRVEAFEKLDQHKQAELRQKTEELAARGIPQSSGIFLSEMNRVRDKWDRLKAQNENQLLTGAVGERQRRLTQALGVLSQLAGAEEGRLDAALALSMIPLNLQNQAFQNLVTATNLGGNASAFTGGMTNLLQLAMQQQLYDDSAQGNALEQLLGVLGYFFGA